MSETSFLPTLMAGVISFALGYVWYHPRVFGAMWLRLAHIQPEHIERGKRQIGLSAPLAFLASVLIAHVMNHIGTGFGVADVGGAVQLAFVCWIGFVAPTMLGMVLWEHRPFALYALNALYWLVSLTLMAIILLF